MDKNIKIALVGPGLMPIPPVGWGAIEILIWKYYQELKKLGYDVTIFNSKDLKEVSMAINNGNFDFVHVHYDQYIHFFLRHLKKPFCITSHYGLILQKDKWSRGYFSIFADFLSAPGIIALSPVIKNLYLDNNYKGPVYVLKNGINVNDFKFTENGNGKVLCLGKIEPRKRQSELARIIDGKISVDFVGPNADTSFKEGETAKYLGTWKKEEVQDNLTSYSTLVLLSRGEAAPMVVVEALSAGVSVVVSESASANLENHPFITIIKDDESSEEVIVKALKDSVENNFKYRKNIREYAKNNFDNSIIMNDYVSLIEDFLKMKDSNQLFSNGKNGFIRSNFLNYFYSRIWLIMSEIKIIRLIYKNFKLKK